MSRWSPPWNVWLKPEHVPQPKTCCCGGLGYYRLAAPLGHPLFGKGVPCICKTDELAARQADDLRRWSGMSKPQLLDLTFQGFDPRLCVPISGSHTSKAKVIQEMTKVKRICQDYATQPRGWLVLIGNVGCGKTHLACAIVNMMLRSGRSAHINTIAGMLDALRASMKVGMFDEWIKRLKRVGLLVLDDLGAERATDWANEKMFQLIDARYMNRQPLVVTTNLNPNDERIHARLRSRLQEGAKVKGGWVRVIPIPAGDIRPKKAWRGA